MTEDFLIQLVLILFSARLMGEIAAKFQIPSVIGELVAGVILGPSLFNFIEPSQTIKLLSEIGIVLLLFEVGVESDISKLTQSGLKAMFVAIVGVIFPFLLGYGLSSWVFNLDLLPSLFIGSTLTATSIGITLRVLADLKKQGSPEANVVLGAAVIDDIIGIILLSVLYEFSSTGVIDYFNIGKVLAFILAFLIFAPILASLISKIINRYDEICEIPGLLPTMIVSLLLLFAWLAHYLGAPTLLGGFAAGLALSRHFFKYMPKPLQISNAFSEKVEHQMKPIVNLFTPIFFVTIGLTLNLKEVSWSSAFVWTLSVSLVLAAILGKLACGFALLKESRFVKLAVGVAMIPRGEVGLIFAEVGKSSSVFNQDLYATCILVIALTTLLPPFALRWLYQRKGV